MNIEPNTAPATTGRDHVRNTVGCPSCGAKPGDYCLKGKKTPTILLHPDRWKVFSGGLKKTSPERNKGLFARVTEAARRNDPPVMRYPTPVREPSGFDRNAPLKDTSGPKKRGKR